MSRKTQRKIAKAQIRQTIDDGIKANDVVRVTGLENLLRLRVKKANLQQREQQRLSAKYDIKHARTQQVNTNLDANADYVSGLRMELTRATTPVKKPDANAWTVQGHIYDRHGCPIQDADVSLYSADEKKIETVGAVKTDNKGYYQLNFAQETGVISGGQILDTGGESVLAGSDDSGAPGSIRTNARGASAETTPEEIEDTGRLSSGLRINTNINANASVFVRANDPQDPDLCADSTLINPGASVCSYRDIIINTSVYKTATTKDRRATQYLGNSASRELHDVKNEQNRCQVNAIRFDHCISFNSIDEAIAAGYDYCAYCFGKDKSKR